MKTIIMLGTLTGLFPLALEAGGLKGTVVDRSTALPVAGAIVTVHVLMPDSIAFPDTSGPGGEYDIAGIAQGNQIYVIMAGRAGYKPYYFRYDKIGAGDHIFTIILEPDTLPPGGGGGDSSEVTGQVFGRDRLSAFLSPLMGAEVRLVSGQFERTVTTGADGWFGAFLPGGGYTVTVSAQGYGTGSPAGVTVGAEGLTFGTILVSAVTGVPTVGAAPVRFELLGAYPNPFNPSTTIRFTVPERAAVRLSAHNVLGEELATLLDATIPAGSHSVNFTAGGMASGVILIRLQVGGQVAVSRAVLVR